MAKILVTGANGLLGSNICQTYFKVHQVIASSITKPDFLNCINLKLDITNFNECQIIDYLKPDLIIHSAALVNVDYCEEHPKEAELVNVIGTRNIAEAAKRSGSYLIHISTDAVFDGKKSYPENYSELDIVNPINVYAQTKLSAEHEVQKVGGIYSIVRTNIYGWNRKNKESLAEWMLNKLEHHERLTGITDVYFSPVLVNHLAETLLELYLLKHHGLINLTGSESCSKLEFAYKIADIFKLDQKLIEPISVDSLHFKAKRSKNMSLNTDKAKRLLKTKLLNIDQSLKMFKKLRDDGYVKQLKMELSEKTDN